MMTPPAPPAACFTQKTCHRNFAHRPESAQSCSKPIITVTNPITAGITINKEALVPDKAIAATPSNIFVIE